MSLSMIEWQRVKETILGYVRQHPGYRIQDVVAGTKYAYTEIARVAESMVESGRLERWYSYGTQYFYIAGVHTPIPTTKPLKHDRHIEAYLDLFDECMERYEFCDECMTSSPNVGKPPATYTEVEARAQYQEWGNTGEE